MRVLLVNTNQALQPYPVFPIGLCSIASMLEKHGHEASLLDLSFSENTEKEIRERVRSFRPELVGAGIRNIDNSDLFGFRWFLPDVRRMIQEVRRFTDAPIVLGGAAVSVMPKAVLDYMECGLGVVGDGEQPFLELVRALEEGTPVNKTAGICGRINGEWFSNPKNPVTNYEYFGAAHMHRFLDVKAYLKRGSVYPVQTNRGCAFSCIYCTYTQIEGKKYRLRPEEIVVEEVREAHEKAGVNYFEFVDSVFNVPEPHAKNVCRSLIRAGLGVKFGAAGINPKWLTPELLELMEEAGFSSLDITVESASGVMLKNMKKGFEAKDVYEAARRVRGSKIKVLWIFLVGGPGETLETLEESFRFIDECVRPGDLAYITSGMRIYPDTELAVRALEEGAIRSAGDLVKPVFYLSPGLSFRGMQQRLLDFRASHPNVIVSFDTANAWIPAVYGFLNLMRAPRPYWRYSAFFNRALQPLRRFSGNGLREVPASARVEQGAYYLQEAVLQ